MACWHPCHGGLSIARLQLDVAGLLPIGMDRVVKFADNVHARDLRPACASDSRTKGIRDLRFEHAYRSSCGLTRAIMVKDLSWPTDSKNPVLPSVSTEYHMQGIGLTYLMY